MMRDRDKDWRQTGRGGDREGEQTYVSSTSVVGQERNYETARVRDGEFVAFIRFSCTFRPVIGVILI